jgi:hypothetical protein
MLRRGSVEAVESPDMGIEEFQYHSKTKPKMRALRKAR